MRTTRYAVSASGSDAGSFPVEALAIGALARSCAREGMDALATEIARGKRERRNAPLALPRVNIPGHFVGLLGDVAGGVDLSLLVGSTRRTCVVWAAGAPARWRGKDS
jgi:hypothetical protein